VLTRDFQGGAMKLTKTIVDGLPFSHKGQKIYWDDTVQGLGVRVTKSAKSYVVQGRVNGKTRRVKLGTHGVITLDQARKKAIDELSKMNDGIDPSIQKKAQEALSVTLAEVVEAYIRDRRELKESSIRDIQKHLKTTFGDWKEKPVGAITRDMVLSKFRQKTKISPAQTNQAFRILRALFNYAKATYRADDKPLLIENPVAVLSDAGMWNHIQARTGKVSTDKIGAVWNWIQEQREAPQQTTNSRTVADCISFMLLTGVRSGEAVNLKWENLNLEDGYFELKDPKNKNPVTLPISSALFEILNERPRINEYVFPGRSKGHLKEVRGTLEKVTDTAGTRIRPHDLRRTFRAIAAAAGVEFWKTKLLMNHKPGADITLQAYTELNDLRYLKPDTERITAWVREQAAIAASPKIIRIRSRESEI